MKLRNKRGPNCDEARVRVTMVMEKTTPATVMVELAIVARTLRAPSAPPAQIQAVSRAHLGFKVVSMCRVKAESRIAPSASKEGRNQ